VPWRSHSLVKLARKAAAQLPYVPRALALVWRAAPAWTLAWVALVLAQGFIPVAIVQLTRTVVNSVAAGLTGAAAITNWSAPELRTALLLVALLFALTLLAEVLRSITAWVRTAQAELVRDHIANLTQLQGTSVDLAFYEDSHNYDRLFRARGEAATRPLALLENLGTLAQSAVALTGISLIILPFGLWLPLVLLGSTLPALAVALRTALRQHRWRLRNTAAERRALYYDVQQSALHPAAEIRLFDLGAAFRDVYQRLRRRLRGERIHLAREQAQAEIVASALALTGSGGCVLWMVYRALSGTATLGDVAMLYQAFNQGQQLLRGALDGIAKIYSNSLFLEDLFELLSVTPRVIDPAAPAAIAARPAHEVRFENVTFSYPGRDTPALADFSLVLPAGGIVAIVGPNGAGKSTVLKLLCRFYDPDAGRVLLDGADLRDLALKDLRARITVLFQSPLQHEETVGRNIAYSDLGHAAQPQIEAAAQAAGADEIIARLPKQYETILGRWFGGVQLSGGEWQRIALARAFLRQAPIVLLDEPTSAMDSWAEADWLDRFRALVEGRTALIITHRFTTAMRADVIVVMDGGRIVESGSHDELLAGGGVYARSWSAQMRAGAGAIRS
jgi:ATP-binding cassette subfamily B protein